MPNYRGAIIADCGPTPAPQTTRRAYLNLVKKLKFDEEDCILGNDKKGELRCIFDLIRHDPAEFHLRVDQGICDFVKEWLTSE